MNSICVFFSAAFVVCLSASAGVAVGEVNEDVSDPASRSQTEPVLMAGFFDIVQDAVQTIEAVDGAIDLLNQVTQQDPAPSQENRVVGDQLEQQSIEEAPVQISNEELHQRLARRNNESHEAWYDRIRPMINVMPGPDYRVWKATLSLEDREAYDAITKQRNYEAAEFMNQVTPLILEGVLQDNYQEQDCNDDPEFGSITCP